MRPPAPVPAAAVHPLHALFYAGLLRKEGRKLYPRCEGAKRMMADVLEELREELREEVGS